MANITPDDRWVVEDDGLFCPEVGPWAETNEFNTTSGLLFLVAVRPLGALHAPRRSPSWPPSEAIRA